jgi:hypothetical protein
MCGRPKRDLVGGVTRWNLIEQVPDERDTSMFDIRDSLVGLAHKDDTS